VEESLKKERERERGERREEGKEKRGVNRLLIKEGFL
jgi:hypothetical protein